METHGLYDVDAALCRLPITCQERGDVSKVNLIRDIGYAEHATTLTDFLDPGMALITKPFSLEKLAASIGTLIGARRQG